jgi:hypothetical protein
VENFSKQDELYVLQNELKNQSSELELLKAQLIAALEENEMLKARNTVLENEAKETLSIIASVRQESYYSPVDKEQRPSSKGRLLSGDAPTIPSLSQPATDHSVVRKSETASDGRRGYEVSSTAPDESVNDAVCDSALFTMSSSSSLPSLSPRKKIESYIQPIEEVSYMRQENSGAEEELTEAPRNDNVKYGLYSGHMECINELARRQLSTNMPSLDAELSANGE